MSKKSISEDPVLLHSKSLYRNLAFVCTRSTELMQFLHQEINFQITLKFFFKYISQLKIIF